MVVVVMAAAAVASCRKDANGDVVVKTPVVDTRTDTVKTPSVEVTRETVTTVTPKVEVKKETSSVTVPKVTVKPKP
jgi:repressor of nif and glnA expression